MATYLGDIFICLKLFVSNFRRQKNLDKNQFRQKK